jgi:hypothetical protein
VRVRNCVLLKILFFTFNMIKIGSCIKKMFFSTLTLFTMLVNLSVVCSDRHVLASLPQHFVDTPSIYYFVLSSRVGQWNKRERI